MQTNQNYDTIIIGGGPSGCTTAALLAEQGLRVLVLESGLDRTRSVS